MKKKRKNIAIGLLFISIIMLIAAVYPHHHHYNGSICMKPGYVTEHNCTNSTHNNPEHEHPLPEQIPCDTGCMTHFQSPSPVSGPHNGPNYCIITTLFTHDIIKHLLRPLERRIKNYYIYRDPLHDTILSRATSLRAPPAESLFA